MKQAVGNRARTFWLHAVENLMTQCEVKGIAPSRHEFAVLFDGAILRQVKEWMNEAVIMLESGEKEVMDAQKYRFLAGLLLSHTSVFIVEKSCFLCTLLRLQCLLLLALSLCLVTC